MAACKHPRSVEFIDALPKSGPGKILWRVLRERERQKPSGVGDQPSAKDWSSLYWERNANGFRRREGKDDAN